MKYRKNIYYSFFLALTCLFSCSKMEDTMREFVKGGELVYPAKVKNILPFAGKNRIKLSMVGINAKVTDVGISWNNKADSLMVPVDSGSERDTFDVLLPELEEGVYSFTVITYDELGNSSVKVDTIGNVYGDTYAGTLKARVLKEVLYDDKGNLQIIWAGAGEGTIGNLFKYSDVNGTKHEIYESVRDTTILEGFKPNENLEYQTVFLPEPTAIDTFYSKSTTKFVEGPRVDILKDGWFAEASSEAFPVDNFDNRPGGSYRPPSNAVDDDPGSLWVNRINGSNSFPHTITVDMGQEHLLSGFYFIQRQNSNASLLKDLKIEVSRDGSSWKSAGNYSLSSDKDKLYIDIPQEENARYFRVICLSANDNGVNIALAEVGVFIR